MSATLHYFNGRGKAEIVRLSMAAAKVEFSQVDITEKHQFEALKTEGKLVFGQLPLVEYEGNNLVQSCSTARYFAAKGDLLGSNEQEKLNIDILFEGTRDFNSAFMSYGFAGFKEVLDNGKQTAIPKYLPVFNSILSKNGSNGHLVGSKLSLADLGLLEVSLTIEELLGEDELRPYPEVQNFLKVMKSNEAIANYLRSDLRKKKNDERYVAEVQRVLN
uniref:Glutathione S-transferase A1/2-2 n=1 Tax=Brachionus calyciflorus TaxID=104777 RepID=A0A3G2JS77_9BILA|nr:glutathione S-transferase A1/2-2 [Brachionus calyciflorus]